MPFSREHLDFLIQMFETDGGFDCNTSVKNSKEVRDIRRGMSRLSNVPFGFFSSAELFVYRVLYCDHCLFFNPRHRMVLQNRPSLAFIVSSELSPSNYERPWKRIRQIIRFISR